MATTTDVDARHGAALVRFFNDTIFAPQRENAGAEAGNHAIKWAAAQLEAGDRHLLQAHLADCLATLRDFADAHGLIFDPYEEEAEDAQVTALRIT